MKPVRIAPPASEEFTETVRWYESKRVGLGGEFFDAVLQTIEFVKAHPEIGVSVSRSHSYRQILIDGFPYKLIYRERTNDTYIVAIAHTSRQPNYWRRRS